MSNIKSVRCNKCGQRSDLWTSNINSYHTFHIRFAYPSDYDLLEGDICLCEKCLLELMDTFRVAVSFIEYNPVDHVGDI